MANAEQKKSVLEMDIREVMMPVDRLHYTALTQLLRNPLIFKLKYILNSYDGKVGVSGMVGRAAHEALRVYYKGDPELEMSDDKDKRREQAIDYGLKYIDNFSDFYIDYGKKGSRSQILKFYTQAMNFYFAEEPEYNKILFVEEKMEAEIKTINGDILPLPAVGVPDLIDERKDGGVEIIDTKFVRSFTDYETEDYIKIIQAQFLWHLLKAKHGIVADRMLFREVKYTENAKENAGKPQIRDYAVPFNHEPYRVIFYNIYKDVVKFISNPDSIYLPNLSDTYDGEQAGLLYAQGLISADMSDVEVMHKVKDVALVSKRFVSSRLDRVENQHLMPEEKIKLRLAEFGIPVEPKETVVGASVTQYRFKVSAGIRMTLFEKHKADIARALEAKGDIRILAPIPGTGLVGIEVANENRTSVKLTDAHLEKGTLSLPIGVTISGEVVKVPLNEMPHLLIAGATGSGKSVLLHSLITALIRQLTPKQMHLILIDPKRVELVAFSDVDHLAGGIIYEYAEAVEVLRALIETMENRYKLLEKSRKRDIKEYNAQKGIKKLPYKVVVIDEFADLMFRSRSMEKYNKDQKSKKRLKEDAIKELAKTIAKKDLKFPIDEDMKSNIQEFWDVEGMIARLAAMARAVGIHLIIATQRPSVDVITGLIKANFPTRIALTTSSPVDSKVILGEEGAEKLSGKGDLLLMFPGMPRTRLQAFMLDDAE